MEFIDLRRSRKNASDCGGQYPPYTKAIVVGSAHPTPKSWGQPRHPECFFEKFCLTLVFSLRCDNLKVCPVRESSRGRLLKCNAEGRTCGALQTGFPAEFPTDLREELPL